MVLSCLPSVRAQISASIKGIATDPSGAPLPSAVVKAKNLETGAIRSGITDDAGRYLVLALPVGEYEVRVTKPGFQEAIRSGIHLVVGEEAIVDLRLQGDLFAQSEDIGAEGIERGGSEIASVVGGVNGGERIPLGIPSFAVPSNLSQRVSSGNSKHTCAGGNLLCAHNDEGQSRNREYLDLVF